MAYNGHSSAGGADNGQMTIGDYASGVPNIRLSQIPGSLIRQIPWMLILAVIGIATIWFLTRNIKRQYVADGSLFVQVGSEYVYDPASGSKNSGVTITPDYVTQTEAAIIKNQEILDSVTYDMFYDSEYGGERFAPKLANKYLHSQGQQQIDRWNDILKLVDRSYMVSPKPKAYIIGLGFKHEDPEVAVETLNRFMTAYQVFRKSKFVSETSNQVAERRLATEQQLKTLERKIQNILNKNSISDFPAEQKGAQKRAEELRAALNNVRGKISASEAALAASEDQLRAVPETIDLYVDDRASQRLAQAKLEKRQLLAKYLPNSRRVLQKEAEIREIEAQIQAGGGKPTGGRRVGPNRVYQNLLTQRNKYQAEADSYREQEATIVAQLNAAVSKVRKMRVLSPKYESLLREKASLEERLKGLNAKEQAVIVDQRQQEASSDNIKVMTTPSKARKGRNMKKIFRVLGSAGVLFTVFMLGLLRVFLDPKLYGPAPSARKMPVGDPYQNDYVPEPVSNYAAPLSNADQVRTPVHPSQPAYAPAAAMPPLDGMQAHLQASSVATPVFESPAYDEKSYSMGHALQEHAVTGFENPVPNSDYGAEVNPIADPIEHGQIGAYTPNTSSVQPEIGSVQGYDGPTGEIPVLGSTQSNPYAKS